MKALSEGMRQGDLEDLVLPLLSLDEFVSKIDDDAVVIAFFVNERGAADDLNRFLQRSPIDILDTEVSPAPDSHGYFMVFVELLNNTKLADNIEGLLEEVASLTAIETWKMKVRGSSDLVPFSAETVRKAVPAPDKDEVRESVLAFLQHSELSDARFEADRLILEGERRSHDYAMVGFGDVESLIERHGLNESAQSMTLSDTVAARNLATLLGQGWMVHRVGDCDVLQRSDSDQALVVRA